MHDVINGQISGLFFAVAFWIFVRKMGQKIMKNFFNISSLGIISLFSSMQAGSPFYGFDEYYRPKKIAAERMEKQSR